MKTASPATQCRSTQRAPRAAVPKVHARRSASSPAAIASHTVVKAIATTAAPMETAHRARISLRVAIVPIAVPVTLAARAAITTQHRALPMTPHSARRRAHPIAPNAPLTTTCVVMHRVTPVPAVVLAAIVPIAVRVRTSHRAAARISHRVAIAAPLLAVTASRVAMASNRVATLPRAATVAPPLAVTASQAATASSRAATLLRAAIVLIVAQTASRTATA